MTIPKTMRAAVLDGYDQIRIAKLPVPKPGHGEVLCRIRSVAICGSDPPLIHGGYSDAGYAPYFPFVPGHEWAGEVVSVGEGVAAFKIGDRVAGEAHRGCGVCENCKAGRYTICLNYGKDGFGGPDAGHRHYGFHSQGANAEYGVFFSDSLTPIPDHVSFDEASLCDCAGAALHAIELTGITPGGIIAVVGAGPVGLCAIQEAKGMGAGAVIAVDTGYHLEAAKELGADYGVDFASGDPVAAVLALTGGRGCDEVFECCGAPAAADQCCRMVRKGGAVTLVGNYHNETAAPNVPLNRLVFDEIRIQGSKANPNMSAKVLRLISCGVLHAKRMITHSFPLEDYAAAISLFERKEGHVIKAVIHP